MFLCEAVAPPAYERINITGFQVELWRSCKGYGWGCDRLVLVRRDVRADCTALQRCSVIADLTSSSLGEESVSSNAGCLRCSDSSVKVRWTISKSSKHLLEGSRQQPKTSSRKSTVALTTSSSGFTPGVGPQRSVYSRRCMCIYGMISNQQWPPCLGGCQRSFSLSATCYISNGMSSAHENERHLQQPCGKCTTDSHAIICPLGSMCYCCCRAYLVFCLRT